MVLLNVIFAVIILTILFNLKQPFQTIDVHAFSIPHYLVRMAAATAFQVVCYYLALNWYYRLLSRSASWKAYLLPVLAIGASYIVYYLLYDLTTCKEELKFSIDISLKIFSYGLSSVFQIFIPLVIAVVTRQLDEKKWQAQNQKVLEQRTFQLEKEKMQADYLFLKAQINPHFLHNTLNFLYSRSLPYSSELSEGILTLSEIMRYSLDKTEGMDGKVPLSKEIEHVHHVLKIQQLQ